MSDFILSAFSDEYADTFEDQLSALRELGINNTELRHLDRKNVSELTKDEVLSAKSKLDRYGISVSAIGSPIGKIKLDGDIEGHFEMARRVFESATLLGAKYVRFFSFYAPDGKNIASLKDEVFDLVSRLVLLARESGVVLCHENEANIYGSVPDRCLEIFKYFNGEVKCVFDMGNFVLEGISPYPEAYDTLRDHIAYFHIKDALKEGAVVPPGRGDAHIKEILKAHKAYAKDDFFVSLEPHLQTFSGLNALVGRGFDNPYKYADRRTAFFDAANKFKELFNENI